jgi:hypothetical protein
VLPNNELQSTMVKRSEHHRYQECEHRQDVLPVVLEKLNVATQVLAQNVLNSHWPQHLASADDLQVQMLKAVRRYEEMLRKVLVSQ